MATYDYLRKQALKDVWRVPTIDRQFIINPQRVTKNYGRMKNFTVMWDTLSLPDNNNRWHVYDASSLAPVVLNLFKRCEGWTPLSEATNKRGVYTNLYVGTGLELPRFDSYYRYTESGVLIIAVRINKKLKCNLDKDAIYLRVYSGAFNYQNQVLPNVSDLQTFGCYVLTSADRDEFDTKLAAIPQEGITNIYHNGIWVQSLNGISVNNGDYLEYIWDKSFYKSEEWAIKDLFHYESTMDKDQKYLLHHPALNNDVDFYDDIDIYIYQKRGSVPFRGIYFHKNNQAAVRQLTHRDFGLRTKNIPPIATLLDSLTNPHLDTPTDSLFIRLDYRKSGLQRNKLVFENFRIFELYKLSDTDIVRAMQGIDSNVPFWSAPELEKSLYTYCMRCSYNQLTKEVAEQMYGYNASAKIVGDSPVKVDPTNVQDVVLPIRMQHGCTVYEYNSLGHLTNWYQHLGGQTYRPKDSDTTYLELIVGLGGDRLDQLFNCKSTTLNEVFTYRVYNGSIIGNAIQSGFEDVTGSDKYTVVDNQYTWVSQRTADFPIVMSDSRFFAKDYKLRPNSGNLTITLTSQQNRPTGDGYYVFLFPMGQLDVFLNYRPLIRGLDYFYDIANQKIIITNHEYLDDPLVKEQIVHVRFCGFPTKDFQITSDDDVGFIEHGFLSNNNRYDLRDDKVQRIVVGGRLFSKEDVEFSEEHSGISIVNAANGLPYMIKDVLVPVKPYTVEDMYVLRDESKKIDKIVSDYLTLKLPQPSRGPIMAIPNKYRVFSPFFNKIVTDLKENILKLPLRIDGFSKQEVIDKCKDYEHLLKNDPIKSPHLQDDRFVVIIPHGYPRVVAMPANSYRFLSKVVELYADGLVQLSPFIKTN